MPKIVCNQCGATGTSKNPDTRRCFADDQLVDISGLFISYPEQKKKDVFRIDFNIVGGSNDLPPELRALEVINDIFNSCKDKNVDPKQIFCDHKWELAPGEVATC